MPFLILVLCAIVCTFFIARFFAAKTRLVEKTIEETIARKLATSAPNMELLRLREENGVMRNLLIDIVENETVVLTAKSEMSDSERSRATIARAQRRREVTGEAIFVLRQTEKSRISNTDLKIHG